jgi:hypothetical protein
MRPLLLSLSMLAALAVAGCGEKPPRSDPESVPSYNAEPGPSLMRERTLEQGESLRPGAGRSR